MIYSHIFRLDQINPDTFHAIAEIEHPGGAIAQVHDSVPDVRAAIIHPNDDPLAILQVGYLYESPKRELPVRGCEFKHVKVFAAGCGPAVELLAVPGGCAYLIRF